MPRSPLAISTPRSLARKVTAREPGAAPVGDGALRLPLWAERLNPDRRAVVPQQARDALANASRPRDSAGIGYHHLLSIAQLAEARLLAAR